MFLIMYNIRFLHPLLPEKTKNPRKIRNSLLTHLQSKEKNKPYLISCSHLCLTKKPFTPILFSYIFFTQKKAVLPSLEKRPFFFVFSFYQIRYFCTSAGSSSVLRLIIIIRSISASLDVFSSSSTKATKSSSLILSTMWFKPST